MSIRFDKARMQALKPVYRDWWDGRLQRPLVRLTITDAHDAPHTSPAPLLSQATCADFSWTAEQMIDATDARLSRQEYLGDAFPLMDFTAFGPGVLAAMCGAILDNSSGAVWFFPKENVPIEELHINYDPNNRWTQRIKDLYRAGRERWQRLVVMGMPDLGGILDVVASLRGTENLLIDLYDAPQEVLRLIAEAEIAWQAAYDDFSSVLQQTHQGYADWSGLWSDKPSYIIQSDFCYMLGTAHFDTFVLPSIRRQLNTLHDVIYHLDGVGQLPHLPQLLQEPKLRAIQWVYGDGQPTAEHWIDIYKQIERAGKGSMVIGEPEEFIEVARHIRHGLYYNGHIKRDQMELARKVLAIR